MIKVAIENIRADQLSRVVNSIVEKHNFEYRSFKELGVKEDDTIRLLCRSKGNGKAIVTWEYMSKKLKPYFKTVDAETIIGKQIQIDLQENEVAIIQEKTDVLIAIVGNIDISKDAKFPVRSGYYAEQGEKSIKVWVG